MARKISAAASGWPSASRSISGRSLMRMSAWSRGMADSPSDCAPGRMYTAMFASPRGLYNCSKPARSESTPAKTATVMAMPKAVSAADERRTVTLRKV
jgi:hypothetical protein